jgi:hypothetical protein
MVAVGWVVYTANLRIEKGKSIGSLLKGLSFYQTVVFRGKGRWKGV